MVERSYGAGDLVQLPRLSVSGAIALGTEVLTVVAEAGPLPAIVQKRATRLETRHTSLRAATIGRLVDPNPNSEAAKLADRNLDGAWSATSDWASGWVKLPLGLAEEKAQKARALQGVFFGDGLRFTQLPYKLEWAESQIRLERVETDGLDAVFTALGGDDFLQTLRKAHEAYGIVLGVTKTKPTVESVEALRGPLEAFCEALRMYVVSVTAHADPDDPATVALADRLLAPLTAWETKTSVGTSKPEVTPTTPAENPTS